MQRYNPMTKCLETVKTNDRKTVDFDRTYYKDKYNSNKVWEITKQSGGNYYVKQFINGKQFGKGTRMSKEMVMDLGLGKKVKSPTEDRKTVDSKIKTVNASELKQGNTIVQTGEKIISVENIGDKVKIVAKRVLAGGATPSIYKVAPNTKIKITDKRTVDSKTFYYVTYYVMGRGKETKYFENKNDAIKFYNSTEAADKPKSVTYNNPQKIEELEEHIKYQNYRY